MEGQTTVSNLVINSSQTGETSVDRSNGHLVRRLWTDAMVVGETTVDRSNGNWSGYCAQK